MQQPVLVIGETGQVARALARIGSIGGHALVCRGRSALNATDGDALAATVTELTPSAIINAAAYTGVDKAESEPAAAQALNAALPGRLAELCAAHAIPLIHISTDYVFDGQGTKPYRETDPIAPLGVYGATKAEGEARVRAMLDRHFIVRTAWVYGEDGHNFARSMLRLARDRAEVRVVDDQRGSPTHAGDLAEAICRIVAMALAEPARDIAGTYHLTGGGETTWCGFARAIFAEAKRCGLKTPVLTPITTAEFPTPARRPAYSVLDNSRAAERLGVALPDWTDSLAKHFARITP